MIDPIPDAEATTAMDRNPLRSTAVSNAHRRSLTLPLAALGTCIAAYPAAAQTVPQPASPPLTIDGLKTMVANMGYDCKPGSDGVRFSIVNSGSYELTITLAMSTPGSDVLVYAFLNRYNPEEIKKLNLISLMESNDVWTSYFSLSKSENDYLLYLQFNLPSVAVSPAGLRNLFANLQRHTLQADAVWNTAKWP